MEDHTTRLKSGPPEPSQGEFPPCGIFPKQGGHAPLSCPHRGRGTLPTSRTTKARQEGLRKQNPTRKGRAKRKARLEHLGARAPRRSKETETEHETNINTNLYPLPKETPEKGRARGFWYLLCIPVRDSLANKLYVL